VDALSAGQTPLRKWALLSLLFVAVCCSLARW